MDTSQPIIRPRYQDATPEQLARICNGVGPAWAPTPVRKLMTMLSSWFFDEASWNHHDFGYYIGCRECCRREYDHKFFMAMLRDALLTNFQNDLGQCLIIIILSGRPVVWLDKFLLWTRVSTPIIKSPHELNK